MRVGPYLVDAEHRKEGGQAFVYFGEGGDQQIALKVARPSNWSQQRMKREIAVQNRLDHPNVSKIIRHDVENGWYSMSRARESLEDLGPFPRDEWTRLRVGLLAVAQAVTHAHEHGYVHRDRARRTSSSTRTAGVWRTGGSYASPFGPGSG